MVTQVNGVWMVICEWFAKCENPTLSAAVHPILGPVPCCDRCARKLGLDNSIVIEIQS